jgi:hypothetical protein
MMDRTTSSYGAVDAEVLFHPVVKQVLSAPHLAVGAEQVHKEVGPLIHVSLTLEQLADELVALGRVAVGDERAHLVRRSQAAGKIERYAAQEFVIRGEWSMRNAVALHLAEDMLVNEIANGDAARG